MAATNRATSLIFPLLLIFLGIAFSVNGCTSSSTAALELQKDDHIVLIGGNLCSRMMNYGHFETEMHVRFPDSLLTIRNMCDGGDTPGFRPHSGRVSPWAFDGAEQFQTEFAKNSNSQGHFEYPDEWITRLGADVILAFFGYSESFEGPEYVDTYKAELDAFIKHTLSQTYNGESAPRLALVSPIAFEDLSSMYDLPDGSAENANLSLYTSAMREVAEANEVPFIDVFSPSQSWYNNQNTPMTADGFQLTNEGYATFSDFLADQVFGSSDAPATSNKTMVHQAVQEKNWFWHNDYKIPNGVHVFGRRYNPFGPDNYPFELEKIRQMTAIRDTAIWMAAQGEFKDVDLADQATLPLPPVQTNYTPSAKNGDMEYLYGQDALDQLNVPEGYKIELFASETEFEDLANPVQMSFDNQGRLWIATMPSYPHYKPGDARPNDKLIILEDTDGDGKADKQTTFADGLHLPIGFEFAPEGVYVSQGTNLVLLVDEDGDDKADRTEIILSGFDDHDTHHAISAFVTDPSGAIYMGEGVFLHTSVETAYGTVRATNGGFFRYSPQRRHLERVAQLNIPNPWGIAFDEWGQDIFAETSGPAVRWMLPGEVKSRYGVGNPKSRELVEDDHRVRPTSGLEFVSSRHFPDEVQGDLLINNTIGFLGTKQHDMEEDGTGFISTHRQDLVSGTDRNFRPVDMEFAPDGSLYIVDWHNILIGHMQHNARDPLRDHAHGRVYRMTYPSRPLVEPAKIVDASIEELLDNLKLPEYRTRYRTKRELRARDADEVLAALDTWVDNLESNDSGDLEQDDRIEHHLLEALWVTWGLNQVDEELLTRVLNSPDHRARAAAVRVLRYAGHQIENQTDLLVDAAQDEHGRVRIEAIVAASWLDEEDGMKILDAASQMPVDDWMGDTYQTAMAHLQGKSLDEKQEEMAVTSLEGADRDLYLKGRNIYSRDGYCQTCHQVDGRGLSASQFPPLTGTAWVTGSEERLIKVVLKGLLGPMTLQGKEYPGDVPMTPFEGLLDDEEVAAVLTYVRNSFGNEASVISPEKVAEVRAAIADKEGYYSPAELLEMHPMEGVQ